MPRRAKLGAVTSRQADAARLRVVRRTIRSAINDARDGHCAKAKQKMGQVLYTVHHTNTGSALRVGVRAYSKARIQVGAYCPIK